MIVRDYLLEPARRDGGDFASSIHQHVKVTLRELRPGYQYPRSHSFHTLINQLIALGVLEKTGRTEAAEERGAALGPSRGFAPRTWIRVVPGAETSNVWADPTGHWALLHPGIRPSDDVLPSLGEVRIPPARARDEPTRRTPAAPREAAPRTVRGRPRGSERQRRDVEAGRLEARRQDLANSLRTAAISDETPSRYLALADMVDEFLADVVQAFGSQRFPSAAADVAILRNCVALLEAEEMGPRRDIALTNCQSASRVIAEDLGTPLALTEEPGGLDEPNGPAEPGAQIAPISIPAFGLPERFNRRTMPRFVAHLEALEGLLAQIENPENFPIDAKTHLESLAETVEDWTLAMNERLEPMGETAARELLEAQIETLDLVVDALQRWEITEAKEHLEDLE